MGPEELALASQLMLPLLGPEPTTAHTFASKSGTKQILEDAHVVTPVGAYDLYDEAEVMAILAKLITTYVEFPRWLLKVHLTLQLVGDGAPGQSETARHCCLSLVWVPRGCGCHQCPHSTVKAPTMNGHSFHQQCF